MCLDRVHLLNSVFFLMRHLSLTLNCFMFSCWRGVWAGSNSIHTLQLALEYRVSWHVFSKPWISLNGDKSVELLGRENCDRVWNFYSVYHLLLQNRGFICDLLTWNFLLPSLCLGIRLNYVTQVCITLPRQAPAMNVQWASCTFSQHWSALGVLRTVKEEGSSRWSFA